MTTWSIENSAADFARGFDEIRIQLLGVNAKLVLLKEDGSTKAFDELQVIEAGWNPEFSTFHGTSTFNVADVTASTGANVRKATHLIMRDTELKVSNNILYELKSETAAPDANIPWWRIRASGLMRRYVAPEEI